MTLETVSTEAMGFTVRKFVKLFFDAASEDEKDHNLEAEEDEDQEEKSKSSRNWLDFNNVTGFFIACKEKAFVIDRISKLNDLAYGAKKEAKEEADDDEEILKFFSKNLTNVDFEIKFVKLLNDKYIICGDDKIYIEPFDANNLMAKTALSTEPMIVDDKLKTKIIDLKIDIPANKAFILTCNNFLYSIDICLGSQSPTRLFNENNNNSSVSCFDISQNELVVGYTDSHTITKLNLTTNEMLSFNVLHIDANLHPVGLIILDNNKLVICFDISGKADTTDAYEDLGLDIPRYSCYFVDANNGKSELIDEEFCSNLDINRDFQFYLVDLKKWLNEGTNDLFLVTSSVASYLSPISSNKLYLAVEDEQKASMPLDPETYDDLFISGISVDLLNTAETSIKSMESTVDADLYPIVWILSSTGILTSFDFYDTDAIKKKLDSIKNSTQLNILKGISALASSKVAAKKSPVFSTTCTSKSPYGEIGNLGTSKQNPFSTSTSSQKPSIFSASHTFGIKDSAQASKNTASFTQTVGTTALPGFGDSSFGQSGFGSTKNKVNTGNISVGFSSFGNSANAKAATFTNAFQGSKSGPFGSTSSSSSPFASLNKDAAGEKKPDIFASSSNNSSSASSPFASLNKDAAGEKKLDISSTGSPFASLNNKIGEKKPDIFASSSNSSSSASSPFASLNKDAAGEKKLDISSTGSPFASLNNKIGEKKPDIFASSSNSSSSTTSSFASLNKAPIEKQVETKECAIEEKSKGAHKVIKEEVFVLDENVKKYSNYDNVPLSKPEQYYLNDMKFPAEFAQKNEVEKSLDRVYYETLAEHFVLLKNFEAMELFKKNHLLLDNNAPAEDLSKKQIKDKFLWRLDEAEELGEKMNKIHISNSTFKELGSNIDQFNSNEMNDLQTKYDKFVSDFQRIETNQLLIKKTSKSVKLPYEFEMLTKKLNSKFIHTIKLFEILEERLLELKSKYRISYAEGESVSKKLELVVNQVENTLKQQMQEITKLIKEVYQIRSLKEASRESKQDVIDSEDSIALIEGSDFKDEISKNLKLEISEANYRHMKRKSLVNSVKQNVKF